MAYYLHWSHHELMSLPHRERVTFCKETSQINAIMNKEQKEKSIFDLA